MHQVPVHGDDAAVAQPAQDPREGLWGDGQACRENLLRRIQDQIGPVLPGVVQQVSRHPCAGEPRASRRLDRPGPLLGGAEGGGTTTTGTVGAPTPEVQAASASTAATAVSLVLVFIVDRENSRVRRT